MCGWGYVSVCFSICWCKQEWVLHHHGEVGHEHQAGSQLVEQSPEQLHPHPVPSHHRHLHQGAFHSHTQTHRHFIFKCTFLPRLFSNGFEVYEESLIWTGERAAPALHVLHQSASILKCFPLNQASELRLMCELSSIMNKDIKIYTMLFDTHSPLRPRNIWNPTEAGMIALARGNGVY